MKTRLAALAVLLMAGTATAAFAQDQDRHDRGVGEPRTGGVPHNGGGQSGGGERAQRPAFTPPPAPAPQAPAAPQAQPAPQAREARPTWGGRWGGQRPTVQAPPAGPAGEDGRRFVGRPGTWVDRDGDDTTRDLSPADRVDHEDREDLRQWRRFGGGPRPEIRTPQTDQRPVDGRNDRRGDNRGGPRIENHGGDHPDGDHRDRDHRWGGNRDHSDDHRDDHRGDRRGDHRDNHGRPEWRPGAYPHSFHSNHRFHWRSYARPPHFYARVWSFGEFLPPTWFGPEYVIEDWWDFNLPAPPPGYVWVRVGDDALLVDDYNGRVVQVVRELFW